MKLKPTIALLMMVLAPLVLAAALGFRMARNEGEMARHRLRELVTARLVEIDDRIQRFLSEYTRPFATRTLRGTDINALSTELESTGRVRQLFVIDAEGTLAYPNVKPGASAKEQAFFRRTVELWRSGDPLFHPPDNAPPISDSTPGNTPDPAQQNTFRQSPVAPDQEGISSGWYTWYWGTGLNVIFWWRDADRHTIGVELERMRLISDLVGQLPDSSSGDGQAMNERIVLVDTEGGKVYQWGGYESPEQERPFASQALRPPMNSWRLEYYATPALLAPGIGAAARFNIIAGIAAVATVLCLLGLYLYRENTRAMREAAQRVTFVNQVSHELRTPLTNIRMYAELLAEDLGEDAPETARLGVIVSESQRLSRLIGNLLTFSRKQRNKLTVHTKPGVPFETVRAVLERLRPGLEAKGIAIELTGEPGGVVCYDADALEQILNNLVNNVEKYAVNGRFLGVHVAQQEKRTIITVTDHGSGIPAREGMRIFEPFYRISNKVSDGVTGTGIGLAICRDLARLHGGEVRLVSGEAGAVFEVVLNTPPLDEEVS